MLEVRNNLFYQLKTRNSLSTNPNVNMTYVIKLFRGSFSLQPMYEQFMNQINNSNKSATELTPYEEYVKTKKKTRALYLKYSTQKNTSQSLLQVYFLLIPLKLAAPKNDQFEVQTLKCQQINNQSRTSFKVN